MSIEQFVAESEAANAAGVSLNTLKRFAEAGYLKMELGSDGVQRYSQKDLSNVFGIKFESREPLQAQRLGVERQASAEANSSNRDDSETVEADGAIPPAEDTPFEDHDESNDAGMRSMEGAEPASETARGETHSDESTRAFSESSAGRTEPQTSVENQNALSNDQTARSENIGEQSSPSARNEEHAREVARLKNIIALQEKVLEMRDRQVSDLEEQRRWLRERIEKLEEKGDRDQLLLLAEAQTIRKMITNQESRRNTWRAALEWFGLTTPSPSSSTQIATRPTRTEKDFSAKDYAGKE